MCSRLLVRLDAQRDSNRHAYAHALDDPHEHGNGFTDLYAFENPNPHGDCVTDQNGNCVTDAQCHENAYSDAYGHAK